jgi:hypothetical protein
VNVEPSPQIRVRGRRHGGRTMLAVLAGVALLAIGAETVSGTAISWIGSLGGRHPRAATLTWPRAPAASYYDFILWHDGRRVLDEWPQGPRAIVPVAWSFRGAAYKLVPGRYVWFAYPGFGAKAARHYGALAGSGVLVVPSSGS